VDIQAFSIESHFLGKIIFEINGTMINNNNILIFQPIEFTTLSITNFKAISKNKYKDYPFGILYETIVLLVRNSLEGVIFNVVL
jgi:hypothetical protein